MAAALRSSIGLFGKIPSKRDFVTLNLPNPLLHPWETWLQTGMTEGAAALEAEWREAFLVAPIWRFWLGGDVGAGRRVGVMMPSMDAAGRYFPLTILMRAEDGDALPAPAADRQEEAFAALESAALASLDDASSLESLIADLNAAPSPRSVPDGVAIDERPGLFAAAAAHDPATALAALQNALLDHAALWWTAGGGAFAHAAYGSIGLPSAKAFIALVASRTALAEDVG
jgi:type VI secretion system protein ImpM